MWVTATSPLPLVAPVARSAEAVCSPWLQALLDPATTPCIAAATVYPRYSVSSQQLGLTSASLGGPPCGGFAADSQLVQPLRWTS